MKRRLSLSLTLAILIHLLLLLAFIIPYRYVQAEPRPKTKQEQRIKVALKPNPTAEKNAAVKNVIEEPPSPIAPPMPRGNQLEKIVKPAKTRPLPTPEEQIRADSPEPVKPQKPIPTPNKVAKPEPRPIAKAPIPPEKPYLKVTEEHNRTAVAEVPKESSGLFAKLSKKRPTPYRTEAPQASTEREGRLSRDMTELYGEEFGKLSEGEQKYILDNQEIMRRITQQVLNRVGRVNIPFGLRVNTENVVEFYLFPNGDISDIRFLNGSGFTILDDTTRETIEYAYSRYPRPAQKTLIRYKVGYYLRGY